MLGADYTALISHEMKVTDENGVERQLDLASLLLRLLYYHMRGGGGREFKNFDINFEV
jgi:hypothetical protein